MHEHPHVHPKQPDLEDAPFIEYPVMAQTLANLLIDQAVITADGMQKGIEATDASSPADGARLVARCWVDSAFEARVLQSTNVRSNLHV
jgi:Nitrile hydratase, alpha chain